jgi:hypothetical protein
MERRHAVGQHGDAEANTKFAGDTSEYSGASSRPQAPLSPPPSFRNLAMPLHVHRLDPPDTHRWAALRGRTAAYFGPLRGDIAALVADAALRGYSGCISGLRARLACTYLDAASRVQAARGRAFWRIRDAVAPLMAENHPAAVLYGAARDAGDGLTSREVRTVLADIVDRELRRRRFAHGGY